MLGDRSNNRQPETKGFAVIGLIPSAPVGVRTSSSTPPSQHGYD